MERRTESTTRSAVGNLALTTFFVLLIVFIVVLLFAGKASAQVQTVVVTWGGTIDAGTDTSCSVQSTARGYRGEYQVLVDGVPWTGSGSRGYLSTLVTNPTWRQSHCSGPAPGLERAWWMTMPNGTGEGIEFSNVQYVGNDPRELVIGGILPGNLLGACRHGSSAPFFGCTDLANAQVFWLSVDGTQGTICVGCPSLADRDMNGRVTIQDLFVYIDEWFARDPPADFSAAGLWMEDLYAFLGEYLAPR